jgi:hypothetical protein
MSLLAKKLYSSSYSQCACFHNINSLRFIERSSMKTMISRSATVLLFLSLSFGLGLEAKKYLIIYKNRFYDSKAIWGVAHRFARTKRPLKSSKACFSTILKVLKRKIRMVKVQVSTVINAPIDKVWEVALSLTGIFVMLNGVLNSTAKKIWKKNSPKLWVWMCTWEDSII